MLDLRIPLALGLLSGLFLVDSAHAQWLPNGVALSRARGSQDIPIITSDGAGGAIVGWRDSRDGDAGDEDTADLYLQRITAGGAIAPGWPADGLAIRTDSGSQLPFDILPDGSGGAYVTWMNLHGFETLSDIYVQRVTADGRIAAGWAVDGFAACTAPKDQSWPLLVPDGDGGVFVVWEDTRRSVGFDRDQVDVYAQRITPHGTQAPGWPTNGLPVCQAPGNRVAVNVLSDGVGGLFITWSDSRSELTSGYDVYGARLTADGSLAAGWIPDGTPICTAPLHQGGFGGMVSDGEGGFIYPWTDGRNSPTRDLDIYAQRMTPDGQVAPGWPANGRVLCSAPDLQWNARVVSDGQGGAIVAWDDYRNYFTSTSDVYAQRVLGSGEIAPSWPLDGLALTRELGFQYFPKLVADGTGGAYAVFETTYPRRSADLVLQHVTSSGELLHGGNGAFLCPDPAHRSRAVGVSDGETGMIVAWDDGRDPISPDPYALWVSGARPAPSNLRVTGTGLRRQLTWTLSEPSPGTKWAVLRARKAGEFEAVAQVVAGASVEMSWADDSPPGGVLRYRIRRETENPNYRTESGDAMWPPQAGRLVLVRPAGTGHAGELELSGTADDGPVQIEVFDVQGRLVVQRRTTFGASGEILRLDLAGELRSRGAGIYFARAQDSTGRPTEPLKLVLLK